MIYPILFNLPSASEKTFRSRKSLSILYFSGITNWEGFDDYLTLYDEAGLCYGGAHWIDSEWGYRAYTEQAWEPAYNAADGSTDLSGTLILAESKDNIPAPAQGLYVMDFNMKSLTYELTQVQTVTFTGLNDNWSESPMTQSARKSRDIYSRVH